MKDKIILACILLIAIFFRFYNLSNVPPSASLDEVSMGYNAYSILHTGRDEYGNNLPILLRAYDDWRPALYVYLVIPFVKALGLDIFSVRLPSAILSVLTVAATFYLVKELFFSSKRRILIASLTSFFFAISPWHIYISRLGHEVNAGLFFFIFALLFFLKATNNKYSIKLLTISSVLFALTFYTYQSEKIFIPLLLIVLGFIYRHELFKSKKNLIIPVIVGILLIIPVVFVSLSQEGLTRFRGTSAFSDVTYYRESAEEILKYKNENNLIGQFVNNRRLVTVKIFLANYFSHFDVKFLFLNGGDESFKAPKFGLLYLWELPLIMLGFLYLFTRVKGKVKFILISWLLASFIAPSLTTGAPHAMRAYNLLPSPQIISALGIVWLLSIVHVRKAGKILNILIYFILLASISFYLVSFYGKYFYTFPKNQSSSFQYSLHRAIKNIMIQENAYEKIIFSNEKNLYQSYMFYLFDAKYNPEHYLAEGGTVSGGFQETHEFGKYEFRPINWDKDKNIQRSLLVGNMSDFPNDTTNFEVFKNIKGQPEIKVVNTN